MGIASSRYVCTIGTKEKSVKFFFKVFFRWVWALGCGRLGVGAWVWGGRGSVGWGGGMEMGGLDGSGMEIGRQDGTSESSPEGCPNPNSDCRLGCDR